MTVTQRVCCAKMMVGRDDGPSKSKPRRCGNTPGHGRSGMYAPTTSIVAHLPAIVATLTTANPGAACRIARGAALVAAGAVKRVYNVWLVTSASTPNRAYGVVRVGALLTCACADARRRGNPCKHGWAVACFQAAERLDAEANDPTLQPIGYALTPRALAVLEPHRECSACADQAEDHDGPDGQCTRHGADAEGWWACDCQGFATDDDAA